MLDQILNSLPSLCAFAQEAGERILRYYQEQNFTVRVKDDNTPVTQADWEAHVLIAERLEKFSSLPIVSEESHKATDSIAENTPFWLVDPLDGTKEFIHRTGDFTVNIALIDQKYPVLGVIYAPLTDELFFASRQQGAFKRQGKGAVTRLKTRRLNPKSFTALVSREQKEERATLLQRWPELKILRLGSAIKYCRLAEASADLYVRQRRTYEWDTAAGQCILEEAGGALLDFSGQRLPYRKPQLVNAGLIAFGDPSLNFRDYLY